MRSHSAIAILCAARLTACEQVDIYAVTESEAIDTTDSLTPGEPPPGSDPIPSTDTDVASATDAGEMDSLAPPTEGGTTDSVDEPRSESDAGSEPATTAACATTVTPGNSTISLQVAGATRSYLLHVPTTYDGTQPAPLIVDFHGIGSTGQSELMESPYPAVADAEGVIIAFPDGLMGPLGSGWNMGPCCVADADDYAFARALVADVQERTCIDPDRVYAVGVLTGGGMVYHLACQAADVFAAVAPAAFDLLEETVDDCVPSRPITVMSFRGTADTRVPYAGGPSSVVPGMPITFLGAEATAQRWAEINGCTGGPSTADANGCISYAGCAEDVDVILCTEEGGREDHGVASLAWPVLKSHSR